MNSQILPEDIEIIQEFVQESRDMIELLEPTIIELAGSIQTGSCWEIMDCSNTSCPRHGKTLEAPCWLHTGQIGDGLKTCQFTGTEQGCIACQTFNSLNGDGSTMNAIFRLFHSMKGSASFLDLNNISHVAHAAENLLDLIRSGKIMMAHSHVDLLCQASDFAKEALNEVEQHFNDDSTAEQGELLAQELEGAITLALANAAENSVTENATIVADRENPDSTSSIRTEHLEKFVLEASELAQTIEQSLLAWAENPDSGEVVTELLRELHSFRENCGFLGLKDLETLGQAMEAVLDSCREGHNRWDATIIDTLLEEVDILQETLGEIEQGGPGHIADLDKRVTRLSALLESSTLEDATPGKIRLGELLMEKGIVNPATLADALELQKKPVGEILVEMGKVKREELDQALDEQKTRAPKDAIKPVKKQVAAPTKRQDIRVDLAKLDTLVNLVGELVTAENMVLHHPDLAGLQLESVQKAGEQMNKIVRELQELTMSIRMIPVSGLFRRMIRLVHDLSSKSGKKVELQLSGEDTELDKTVIETITDPLVHLLRNAIDHGLETVEDRLRAEKPEKGTIRLSAQHEDGGVLILLEDDGRGLNREKILAKAIEKGLVSDKEKKMSDQDVARLILMPGFSTADSITDVSGRGVGMDVVKQNIEKIKGRIDISSEEGAGTRISLRIPLTLGIIDGMLARVGDKKCIIPTLAIREAFQPRKEDLTRTPDGQALVHVRDKFYAVLQLHDVLFEEQDERGEEDKVYVLVETHGTRICLTVDELLGQQQTVIKGLPEYFGNTKGLSGCTILGDGEVCLIIDVGSLPELVEQTEIKH